MSSNHKRSQECLKWCNSTRGQHLPDSQLHLGNVNTPCPHWDSLLALSSNIVETCVGYSVNTKYFNTNTGGVLPLTLETCLPLVLLKRLTSLMTDSCILTKLGRNKITSNSWLAKCLPQLMPWAPWTWGPHRRTTVGLWWTFFGVSLWIFEKRKISP